MDTTNEMDSTVAAVADSEIRPRSCVITLPFDVTATLAITVQGRCAAWGRAMLPPVGTVIAIVKMLGDGWTVVSANALVYQDSDVRVTLTRERNDTGPVWYFFATCAE